MVSAFGINGFTVKVGESSVMITTRCVMRSTGCHSPNLLLAGYETDK